MSRPGAAFAQGEDARAIERFLEAMAAEAGASRNTLLAYGTDLRAASALLEGRLACADADDLSQLGEEWSTLARATIDPAAGTVRRERLSDAALTHCTACGTPLRRVLGAPAVNTGGAHLLREGHLAKNGFTQYRKVGKGRYEKTAGDGPDTFGSD